MVFALILFYPVVTSGFCFDEAGREFNISPVLLKNIATVESSLDPGAFRTNRNGTFDIGLMQINSIWLKTLDVTAEELTGDACLNTRTGARILRSCIDRYGYTWEAVGCYNASSKERKVGYAWKVFSRIKKTDPGKVPSERRADTISTSQGSGGSSLVFRSRDVMDAAGEKP